ncbi:Aste57867_17905 [Aphanomyces stellatus]|uniref:Aste57867_17905 protein n=1 Tax=Aphanomyces stellatus TaxID=120398 RepID=A0A485LAG6_9STRA|nr:hypothetical protein As57867_017844 [Aphanomyces stellatus]VFT94647.1 Aste57867_17905 [Aphanomyces stellatus]
MISQHTPTTTCIFNGCDQATYLKTTKCWYHRYRDPCDIQGCFNQARARKRCAAHGGKNHSALKDEVVHVPVPQKRNKRRCVVDGCFKFAHAKYRCVAHGGASLCRVQGCSTQSRNGGLCQRHWRMQEPTTPTIKTEEGSRWTDPEFDLSVFDDMAAFEARSAAQTHVEFIDSTTLELLLTLDV